MAAKVLRERQTRMSCGRRRRSSANSSRIRAKARLGELWTAVNSILYGPLICYGRVVGRTLETKGKRNNGILMKEHRIHTTSTYIDELTDKDSGETQDLRPYHPEHAQSVPPPPLSMLYGAGRAYWEGGDNVLSRSCSGKDTGDER